jgi:hypothetical protein
MCHRLGVGVIDCRGDFVEQGVAGTEEPEQSVEGRPATLGSLAIGKHCGQFPQVTVNGRYHLWSFPDPDRDHVRDPDRDHVRDPDHDHDRDPDHDHDPDHGPDHGPDHDRDHDRDPDHGPDHDRYLCL